jgi:hypothetical protein
LNRAGRGQARHGVAGHGVARQGLEYIEEEERGWQAVAISKPGACLSRKSAATGRTVTLTIPAIASTPGHGVRDARLKICHRARQRRRWLPGLSYFLKNRYLTIMATQYYNKVNSPLDPRNGGPGKRGSHPGATYGPTFSGPTGKTGKPTLILCLPGRVYIRIRANTKPPYQNHCIPHRPYFTPTGRAGGRPIGRRGRANPGLWHTCCYRAFVPAKA